MNRTLGRRLTMSTLAAALGVSACGTANAASGTPLPDPILNAVLAKSPATETVVFAGGCFWGIQAVFQHVKGVVTATSGYSGGAASTAHYEIVSTGATGHAESVKIVFDPSQVTYGQLLKVFFSVAHDPTELNYQGPDHGTQYRSAIFYSTDEQREITQAYIDQLTQAKTFPRPIVTQVVALKAFYAAEAYHQDYLIHHPTEPYIVYNDLPKVAHLKEQFPALYQEQTALP
jgi:peptide-methionine (S)-S-oxide reductase